MLTKFINEEIKYDGAQLSSLWAYRNFNLQGDSIVSFIGECEVKEHLVDLEDLKANAFIYSKRMLHFIIEHFDRDLEKAVLRQRLLISIIVELLNVMGYKPVRDGDDIFINDAKLSVSIATLSPVSSLIHVGLNIIGQGAPVKAIGLEEIGINNIEEFAQKVLFAYQNEIQSIRLACCKVRGVQ